MDKMTPDFEKFCLAHCCSSSCKDRMDYCPIADAVREQYGKIDGTKCEKIYMKAPAEDDTDFYIKGHLHLGYAEEGEG